MWEDNREDQDDREDYLTETRMFVVFAHGVNRKRVFGPYRTIQVTNDSVWVFEGHTPLRIARKDPAGLWEIPDGSDQPVSFRDVLMLCPAWWVTADQIEERLGSRTEE
jgi:hypothetical protein